MSLDEGKLRLYLDGELSEPERKQLETELAHSPKAQAILAELRQTGETVEWALDSLAPVSSTASPAVSALKRLKAQLIPINPGPARANETSPEVASPTVWESPTLLADIRSGLKIMRSGPASEPLPLRRPKQNCPDGFGRRDDGNYRPGSDPVAAAGRNAVRPGCYPADQTRYTNQAR